MFPDSTGEKVAPLEETVPPPPPPVPPPPVAPPVLEAKYAPEDGVMALILGDEKDCPTWCCDAPDWCDEKVEGVEAEDGVCRPP